MRRPEGYTRIAKCYLPMRPTRCRSDCVYAADGVCDNPRINKGNSDAACHKELNRKLLARLEIIE